MLSLGTQRRNTNSPEPVWAPGSLLQIGLGGFTGALGLPTLDGLGLMGDGAHTHEEHVLYSSLVPRAKLLAGLFRTLD